MAQWNGQYSGLSHETKVQDIEESLRKAVKSFLAAAENEKADKDKAVQHLAKRLLAARLKAIRARISVIAAIPSLVGIDKRVSQLQSTEEELQSQGVEDILKEFGVPSWFPDK